MTLEAYGSATRAPLKRRKYQKMQAHADSKGEMADNRQHLARRILSLQHRGPLGMGHLCHHCMTVLGIKHLPFMGTNTRSASSRSTI